MARSEGIKVSHVVLRLNASATEGRMLRRSGYVEATQDALKSVATAPTATGAAVVLVVAHV
jgi:hypothetical protein